MSTSLHTLADNTLHCLLKLTENTNPDPLTPCLNSPLPLARFMLVLYRCRETPDLMLHKNQTRPPPASRACNNKTKSHPETEIPRRHKLPIFSKTRKTPQSPTHHNTQITHNNPSPKLRSSNP
ncbi:hypothetical protein KC19_VG267300 [Ceratodon purpureus]|uniref:Uncharacterized protein n=1 Tax=Ceratodon purpureus TaxID=3225 RepID=A0A8T0HUW4_CERPU|nr:hypothetical protein KC19_VG267300 [Ceratodon purpureus]